MKEKNLLIGGLFLITAQLVLQACSGRNQLPQLGKDKIEAVIAAMTPEEKISMTVGDGKFLPATDPKTIEQGSGIIIANQNSKMVIPRLSIMTSALTDGPSGVNRDPLPAGAKDSSYTTAFPTSTCLAATWNPEMLETVGKAFGNEVLEYEYDVVLMPALNLHRNPKCGRNFEYYSEDPLLSGKLSASIIRGLQSNGIGATLKHFLANNQETNRRIYNAVISQRALREIYLHGFEIAVKEGKPKAIMTSYNKVNGYYTAETPELLNDIVRQEWGFKGLFMTDFDGYGSAVAKVRAGNNMLMSGSKEEYNELMAALKDKTLDESTLSNNLVYNMQLKLNSPRAKGYIPSLKPDLALSSTSFSTKMKITLIVKNTGTVPGKEVIQLYLAAPTSEIEKPAQELKGFAKTQLLQPGESQQLSIELDARSLASFWSGISAWVADNGDYEVRIGASSKDIRLKASFNLSKDITVEKVHDVMYPNFAMTEVSQFNKQ